MSFLPAIVHNRMEVLDSSSILSRITVDRPYFAFQHLYRVLESDWGIYGTFRREQELGAELGPISTAEIGRHLAILGTCAASLERPTSPRCYYLANHATWLHQSPPISTSPDSPFVARARIIKRHKTEIEAEIQLICNDTIVGTLFVRYHVIGALAFKIQFSNCKNTSTFPIHPSPYRDPVPLRYAEIGDTRVEAFSEGFSLFHCSGHFPNYPMWPVAVIMSAFGQTTRKLLLQRNGRDIYYEVISANMEATMLPKAEDTIRFETQFLSQIDNSCAIVNRGYLGSHQVCELHTALKLSKIPDLLYTLSNPDTEYGENGH